MGLKDIFSKVKQEVEVIQGENAKDKYFAQENTYPNEAAAMEAFIQSREKLFRVNKWSDLPGINSAFQLYDTEGQQSDAAKPAIGFFIKIQLPGIGVENWVEVSDIREEENLAEFTVHPSPAPQSLTDNPTEVKHFFIKEASSTFRVEREGNTVRACEIGKNEGINNQGEESGNRAVLNTLIAEGGWAGFQKLQWEKLTSYLVHRQETVEK